jgi:para-nitrobenzyl esterase
MPQIHFAAAHPGPSFFYRFDYKTAFFGAAHALELLFLFDQRSFLSSIARGGPLTGARLRLAQRMRKAWIAFVRTGVPGEDWPVFEADRYATKLFNLEDSSVDDPEREHRLAWEGRDIALGTD